MHKEDDVISPISITRPDRSMVIYSCCGLSQRKLLTYVNLAWLVVFFFSLCVNMQRYRGNGGRAHQERRHSHRHDDWVAPTDDLADCDMLTPYPRPPPYEHPPEYSESQPVERKRRKRRRSRGRRASCQEPSVPALVAESDGPPEYDENERSPYSGDGDVPEMSVRDLLSFSCPSGQTVMPYLVHRESTYVRPCPGRPGDVVAIDRGRYQHIVVNVGDEFVIHKCNAEGLILCQRFLVVAGDDPAHVKNDYDDRWPPFPAEEIVKRAYSKVQQKDGYNTVFANCEHFANWCRYGKCRSAQVDDAVGTITKSVSTKGKEMVVAGGEGGLTLGVALGSVAGGLVGGLLGKVKEALTDEPDEPCRETIFRQRRHGEGYVSEIQYVERKSLCQNGAAVGGYVGGALGFVGGVVGGGLLGLLSGISEGTGKVAKKYGVQLGDLSSASSGAVE